MNRSRARVDVVIPVLNEAHVLRRSVETVREFARRRLPYDTHVVIVDNGSTDGTWERAKELSEEYADVFALHLHRPGRGRALRFAWTNSEADAVCYMDVDLSTDLEDLPKLLRAVVEEGYEVAAGSRLLPGARVRRSWKREVISRLYNVFLKLALSNRFSDAQCGFKALTRRAVAEIVPEVEDESWFFDTELLALAERRGLPIKDLPVAWAEDDDSRVKILRTAWDDIQGVLRLRRRFARSTAGAQRAAARPRSQP